MERPEFVLFWRIKFGDLLQITTARFGNGYGPYEDWLKPDLQENAPWDQMVRELLTALGDPTKLRRAARSTTPSTASRPEGPGRADRPALPRPPPPLRPVPRPPVRRLDPGRLLRPRRLLRQGSTPAPPAPPAG